MKFRIILSFIFLCSKLVASENVTFCAVGDILLDRGVKKVIENHGVRYPFQKIANFINSFDLAFCNLECPLSKKGYPIEKQYTFRADPGFIEGLKFSGFNIYCLANNHSLDYGREALLDTKLNLKKHNFTVIGAGRNQKEASKPVIIKVKGIRIAFLAYVTLALEGITYMENLPGPSQAGIEEIVKKVKLAKKKSDIVIVSFHWGSEFINTASDKQKEYAYRVIENGADLVIGHHPHVIQTIEKYKDKFITYSLGNFIFDQRKKEASESVILTCDIYKSGVKNIRLVPIIIKNCQPDFLKTEELEELIMRIKKLCENCTVDFELKFHTAKLN